jgi:D-arabinose 1-dehydrogenase-like Zn-dependent alcohol dehydrogenase
LQIDPMLLLSRQLSIKGSTPRSREHLIEVLDLAVLGRVKADVGAH